MTWLELKNKAEEGCLPRLQGVKALFKTCSDQQAKESVDDVTRTVINQILFPEGDTDVEKELERREHDVKEREIRILIAGQNERQQSVNSPKFSL